MPEGWSQFCWIEMVGLLRGGVGGHQLSLEGFDLEKDECVSWKGQVWFVWLSPVTVG